MARIGSRDTKPEIRVRRFLHAHGLRYRLHAASLPGKPDLAFPSKRLAIFVHGCFWHRHPGCKATRTPKSRLEFWERKFRENVDRDRRVGEALLAAGWTAVVIWECEIGRAGKLELLVAEIRASPAKGRRIMPTPRK